MPKNKKTKLSKTKQVNKPKKITKQPAKKKQEKTLKVTKPTTQKKVKRAKRKEKTLHEIVVEVNEIEVIAPEALADVLIDKDADTLLIESVTTIPESEIVAEKPVKKKSSVRLYFNSDTQAAIVAYQNAKDDKRLREKLYVTEIMPAFEKLAENLINIHKFTSLHDSFDDLKNDCVNFLFETISKFDASRGTNAFSYFNVVAKNWLIIKTKQKAQRVRRSISLDDQNSLSSTEHKLIEDHNIIPSQEVLLETKNQNNSIVKMLYEIRAKVKTENELSCINSIITIFENINDIDLLNKSAILLYIRELSGLSPKQLTTTMQVIKKHYKKLKIDPKYRLF